MTGVLQRQPGLTSWAGVEPTAGETQVCRRPRAAGGNKKKKIIFPPLSYCEQIKTSCFYMLPHSLWDINWGALMLVGTARGGAAQNAPIWTLTKQRWRKLCWLLMLIYFFSPLFVCLDEDYREITCPIVFRGSANRMIARGRGGATGNKLLPPLPPLLFT